MCKQIFGDLVQSNSNSPRSFQHFGQTLRRNFIWIRQQVKIFPIDPNCKNSSTFDVKIHRMTLSKVGDFYNEGLRGKFEFDWARSDINIAKNSFAIASETQSRHTWVNPQWDENSVDLDKRTPWSESAMFTKYSILFKHLTYSIILFPFYASV